MGTQTYRAIGVMSGTSLDGIDLCEAEFEINNGKWSYRIITAETIPYSANWLKSLENAHHFSVKDLHLLDKNYTTYLSKVILDFMPNLKQIDMVCSHGHTILHEPNKGITYQIGNQATLAEMINKTLICDFRTADVELGGQGAPLVPIGDKLLFAEYDYCINIGGFVNISFEHDNERLAFDVCPANKILNYYAKLLGCDFDDKGIKAKSGKCNKTLLDELNALSFYAKKPPKSLGVEWIEKEMLPILEGYNISHEDKLNTICNHIAHQISEVIKNRPSKVLITGGGAYHDYLIDCIKKRTTPSSVTIPDAKLIEYKEALIFGLLGILKFRGENNVLKSVTGAKENHSSGMVYTNTPH
jgi:anhydro-N-acetylmuramic acid kinase